MKWSQIPLGPLQTNCYILKNEQKSCLIIDPGEEGERLKKYIYKHELKPVAIILTHAHFDHIGAVDVLRNEFQIAVFVHQLEEDWLKEPSLNGSKYFNSTVSIKPADYTLGGEQVMKIGDFSFEIFETPGHSPGSVTFYFKEEKAAFVGDALFKGSIGRTDLRGGNHKQLLKSIHDKLLTLPEETLVLPGHGPATTIGDEMDTNPFLNGF
ncbi:MBL fold metallo-hydrolase [Bacillus sp. 03113]|uniref:MBL fold metallo-hydrolase n=1 Tax=Bacillus sp. 03113 TaxID=2578211 RepID=UPI001143670A|nr:MBL fold metallo-hydrolase [Bacillus sp. 03113]